MIRCIQISPFHSVQGRYIGPELTERNGRPDETGRHMVRSGHRIFVGKLVESIQ